MNLFDIIGPVMVGPSSSHTAGAVKIGLVGRKLLGEDVSSAKIYLHGSFLKTGKGHGTDRAIVGGLLGLEVDDINIPNSFEIAKERGLEFTIEGMDLGEVHPNSAKLILKSCTGKELELIASSLGGGRIEVCEIDGANVRFSGEYATLIVHNQDRPGLVNEVTGLLGERGVNIATMQLNRKSRGGDAVMVLECDDCVPEDTLSWLKNQDGILSLVYFGK